MYELGVGSTRRKVRAETETETVKLNGGQQEKPRTTETSQPNLTTSLTAKKRQGRTTSLQRLSAAAWGSGGGYIDFDVFVQKKNLRL